MNSWDLLLDWVSEVGEGSWQQWRTVAHGLGLNSSGAARSLSDLGHVEFSWAIDRFAAAPTTAVLLPRSSGSVLITGGRPRALRPQLEQLARDGTFDVWAHDPSPQSNAPATWLCQGAMDDIADFCEALGVAFQVQSGRHLTELLPQSTISNAAFRERPDHRLPREWFNPESRKFTTQAGPHDYGWWRVAETRRSAGFICSDNDWYRVPVREFAPYLAYPTMPFLHHRRRDKVLEVDSIAPLPPLLARAATLQSGRIPQWGGRLGYVNVDTELAEAIARRLGAHMDRDGAADD